MLKINDKYSIGSDPLNIIIYETSVITGTSRNPNKARPENIGKERTTAIAFFATIKGALNYLVEHDIKGTGLEDFKTVVAKVEELHKIIDQLNNLNTN